MEGVNKMYCRLKDEKTRNLSTTGKREGDVAEKQNGHQHLDDVGLAAL